MAYGFVLTLPAWHHAGCRAGDYNVFDSVSECLLCLCDCLVWLKAHTKYKNVSAILRISCLLNSTASNSSSTVKLIKAIIIVTFSDCLVCVIQSSKFTFTQTLCNRYNEKIELICARSYNI